MEKTDKTNRALFRLEEIINGNPSKLHECLEKLWIKTKVENGYLKTKCPVCNDKILLISAHGLHWTWECVTCNCQDDGRYDNLLGLIRLFNGDYPKEALMKLTNVVVIPVGKLYGDTELEFGKLHNGELLKNIPASYLMWALHEAEGIRIQQRERIRGYLFGESKAA